MSSKPGIRNVPPPPNSKAGTPYTRFIPREELGDFASWTPGAFGGADAASEGSFPGGRPQPAQAAAQPPEPTAAEWQQRIAAARQAGYQDGYRDGLAALENFKSAFAQQATAQIGALLDAFERQTQLLDGRVAEALALAARQLAAQVLRHELSVQPAVVASVAAEAVHEVMLSARQVSVFAHPDDLPLIAEGAAEALAQRGARLIADATLVRGDVVVDSDVGHVDARVQTRWAQALAALGSVADAGEVTPAGDSRP